MEFEFGVMDHKNKLCGFPNSTFHTQKHAQAFCQGLEQGTSRILKAAADSAALLLRADDQLAPQFRETLQENVNRGRIAANRSFRVVQREVGPWQPVEAVPPATPRACLRCDGCGLIDDGEAGEAWSAWMALPAAAQFAVRAGIVKPIVCPACAGTKVDA